MSIERNSIYNMYLRFGNNPSNTWEIIRSQDDKKITAIYRGRIPNPPEPIEDVTHNERSYRLYKIFGLQNEGSDHMPDVIPLIYYMREHGFEIVNKIRDSKYVFTQIPEQ